MINNLNNAMTADNLSLSKLFSSDYEFHIPPYQRPYAWTDKQVEQLFDDLHEFYLTTPKNSNGCVSEPYFLGSIILIKRKDGNIYDVVDGQQRLTTLTILIASLISVFSSDDNKKEYIEYLKQPEKRSQSLAEKVRLFLRQQEQDFFGKYIQSVQIEQLNNVNVNNETEATRLIKENALQLTHKIKNAFHTEQEREDFGRFLMSYCYLVVVSTTNEDSAFRIFSVMNDRGLDLLPTDVLKSEIIGKIVAAKRENYTKQWEQEEENLGRDNFAEMFSHIRVIYTGLKPVKTLREEFRENVISQFRTSEDLIDKAILPYSKAFDVIINRNYIDENDNENTKSINNSLTWLNRIDVFDWKPAALAFHIKHENDSEYLAWFYQKLERLTAVLFITSATQQERIKRFKEVIDEINQGKDSIENKLSYIDLTDKEKQKALLVLSNDLYDNLTGLRYKYIIMRLDSFVADLAAQYDEKVISIEHVLPQNENAPDWQYWSKEDHYLWLNKLANLVLLTRRKNSEAQDYSFEKKKNKYFQNKSTSTYALTTQVIAEKEWTPEVVKKRQENLLNVFKDKWNLI